MRPDGGSVSSGARHIQILTCWCAAYHDGIFAKGRLPEELPIIDSSLHADDDSPGPSFLPPPQSVPPHDIRGNRISAGLARRNIVPAGSVSLFKDDDDDVNDENHETKETGVSLKESRRPPFAPAGM